MQKGAELELRDLKTEPLSAEELDALIGERDYREFLNPRNELYRERNMKENSPSRAEAIRLMVKEPNLIRRPIVIRGTRMTVGLDEKALNAISNK